MITDVVQPSSTMCRCFTIIYAIIGLAAIFGMVGEAITKYLEYIQSKALQEASCKLIQAFMISRCLFRIHESILTISLIAAKDNKDTKREQDLMIMLSVVAVFVTIVGGGFCYSLLEGWSYMDAIYFSSMTTLVCASSLYCERIMHALCRAMLV
jgi:hypothetical protein